MGRYLFRALVANGLVRLPNPPSRQTRTAPRQLLSQRPGAIAPLGDVRALIEDLAKSGSQSVELNSEAPIPTVTFEDDTAYQIRIDDGGVPVRPGDSLVYTIELRNQSNQTRAGVIVTAGFPPALLQDVSASDEGAVDQAAGTIFWNLGIQLADERAVLTMRAKVRRLIASNASSITLTATVSDERTTSALIL